MRTLVFATNNAHKVEEIVAALGGGDFSVMTLAQCGIDEEIAETEPTLEGNAHLKARFVADRLAQMGKDATVFADDTGLELDALGGAPGVLSARYSGLGTEANIDKVLANLRGLSNRKAQFRTAVSLIEVTGAEYLFEGIVRGEILEERQGSDGFGYDPIFRADGESVSFAQMSLSDKNAISHRGRAVRKMAEHLLSK